MTEAFLQMIQDGGRIVNTASMWGKTAVAAFSAYCASKHALIGLTRSLEMGEKVAIELEFADGKRLSFEAPVQMAPGGHDHANHGD